MNRKWLFQAIGIIIFAFILWKLDLRAAWDILAGMGVDDIVPITYMNSSAALKAFVGRHGGAVCTSTNARAVLEWALEHSDDAEVRRIGWLLTKILGDDVQEDAEGKAQLAQGTAQDRIVSVTDPEMRHGRKSAAHRFDGFKASVSIGQKSELILDVDDLAANAGDGEALMPSIERVEEHADVVVERAIGDGTYISGDNLAACADHRDAQGQPRPIDLVGPLRQPAKPEVHKSAFEIDLEQQTCTFPQRHTVSGQVVKDKQRR